jgi:hypothetical protein
VIKATGGEATDNLFSKGIPLSASFWQALSLDALAEAQHVRPIEDITVLFGKWPGDPEDGFEKMVEGLRKCDLIEGIFRIDY